MKLVKVVLDSSVAPGMFQVGGVRIAYPIDDAALGRELRTVWVRCHGEAEAEALREIVAADPTLELA